VARTVRFDENRPKAHTAWVWRGAAITVNNPKIHRQVLIISASMAKDRVALKVGCVENFGQEKTLSKSIA
jgi:hypothetical protein